MSREGSITCKIVIHDPEWFQSILDYDESFRCRKCSGFVEESIDEDGYPKGFMSCIKCGLVQ